MITRHPDPARCPYPWCTTPHGRTAHPDDEDHRSDGVAVPVFAAAHHGDHPSSWEVGFVRRRNDTETWLVVEDRGRAVLEITLDSARRLLRTIVADPVLATLTGDPG